MSESVVCVPGDLHVLVPEGSLILSQSSTPHHATFTHANPSCTHHITTFYDIQYVRRQHLRRDRNRGITKVNVRTSKITQ